MSLKSKLFTGIALSVAVAGFSTFAAAQDAPASTDNVQKQEKHDRKGYGKRGGHGKGMRGGKHGGMMMRGLRGIELTDVQKEQIRVIHENNKPSAAVMQELQAARTAKRSGGTITPEQKASFKALRQQSRANRDQVQQQILAILTPEQRTQIETRKAEMQEKRQERRELRKQRKAATTPTTGT